MSRLNIDNSAGFSPIEHALPAVGLPETDLIASASFGNHLDRARSSTAERSVTARDETDADAAAADDHSKSPLDSAKARDSAEQSDTATGAGQPEAADTEPDTARSDAESEDKTEQEGQLNGGMMAEQAQAVPGENVDNVDKQATAQLPANAQTTGQTAPADSAAEQNQSQVGLEGKQNAAADSGIDGSETTTVPVAENAGCQTTHKAGEPSDTGDGPPAVQPDQGLHQRAAEQSEAAGSVPSASPKQQGPEGDVSGQKQRRNLKKRAVAGAANQASPQQTKSAAAATASDGAAAELSSFSIDGAVTADGELAESGQPAPGTDQGRATEHGVSVPPRLTSGQDAGGARSSSIQTQSGPEAVDRVQFVQRVARAFRTIGDRGGSVRMRLHPPKLGSLRVEISMRKGAMTARLEVETTSARNMLLDNLPALRDRLAQQSIRVERFDVDLADQQPGGFPEGPGNRSQPQDLPDHHGAQSGMNEEAKLEVPAEPKTATRPGEGSHLDVVV